MILKKSICAIRLSLLSCAFLLILFLQSAHFCFAQNPFEEISVPDEYQQIVLVRTDTWESVQGTLECYSREGDGWVKEELSANTVVGKNGLGWGRGLHVPASNDPEKIEGDGKAPAGVFEFGDSFGYASDFPKGTLLTYRQLTARDYFIDDVNSADYNQWKSIPANQENDPKEYWNSYERMKRSDHLYELGIVVKHNLAPAVKGKGSAIFLHIWRREGSPTVGCTAMSKEDIVALLGWLDPAKKPILIQIPESDLEQVKFN